MIKYKAPGMLFWRWVLSPVAFKVVYTADQESHLVVEGKMKYVLLPVDAAVVFIGNSKVLLHNFFAQHDAENIGVKK